MAASILYGVATYFYYEKVLRTMRTAIVSNLLKEGFQFTRTKLDRYGEGGRDVLGMGIVVSLFQMDQN